MDSYGLGGAEGFPALAAKFRAVDLGRFEKEVRDVGEDWADYLAQYEATRGFVGIAELEDDARQMERRNKFLELEVALTRSVNDLLRHTIDTYESILRAVIKNARKARNQEGEK